MSTSGASSSGSGVIASITGGASSAVNSATGGAGSVASSATAGAGSVVPGKAPQVTAGVGMAGLVGAAAYLLV